jgi:hypothetical protein
MRGRTPDISPPGFGGIFMNADLNVVITLPIVLLCME